LSEGLEYCEQLLVIDLVVELCWLHTAQVESDQVDVPLSGEIWEMITAICIVRSISLNNNRIVRVEMCQDGGLGEGSLEGSNTSVVVGPQVMGELVGEANQRNNDVANPIMNLQ